MNQRPVEEILKESEVFKEVPIEHLHNLARSCEILNVKNATPLYSQGSAPNSAYVVVSGIVGMFLKSEDTSLIPIQVLGPKRVTGLSAFMGTASGYLLEAIPLMDSQLLRIPARQVQAELLVNEGMSELVFRELLRIYSKITRDFAASLTAHLQVSFPAEENCPSHRSAKFLVSRNVASGEVTGVCQRSFACSAEEGNGCPLAAKPALQIQSIWKRSSN